MPDRLHLTPPYSVAGCCSPSAEEAIIGYYSHDNSIRVHRDGCPNLTGVEPERLVGLVWSEILAKEDFTPGTDYADLDAVDFAILRHHQAYDIDYSAVVARKLQLDKVEAFERHRHLKELGLVERVDATMVRYRKGVVDNKWIKHRNHTYYRLTAKGRRYLAYCDNQTDPSPK